MRLLFHPPGNARQDVLCSVQASIGQTVHQNADSIALEPLTRRRDFIPKVLAQRIVRDVETIGYVVDPRPGHNSPLNEQTVGLGRPVHAALLRHSIPPAESRLLRPATALLFKIEVLERRVTVFRRRGEMIVNDLL